MDALRKWCGRLWLAVVFALGLVMLAALVLMWDAWDTPRRLTCALCVLLPAHVFEEDVYPGGFFYMNNATKGSRDPFAYPQNSLTNMFTNLGAELFFIGLAFLAPAIPVQVVVLVMAFGVAEVLAHLGMGLAMRRRLRPRGMRTPYNPGLASAVLALLPLSCAAAVWLAGNGATGGEVAGGAGLVLFVVVGLILAPFAISLRVKSERFAFRHEEAGYFLRFVDRS